MDNIIIIKSHHHNQVPSSLSSSSSSSSSAAAASSSATATATATAASSSSSSSSAAATKTKAKTKTKLTKTNKNTTSIPLRQNNLIESFKNQIENLSNDLDNEFPDTLSTAKKDMLKMMFISNDRKPNSMSIPDVSNDILKLHNDNIDNDNIDVEHLLLSSLSRKRNKMAMLLLQSDQAYKRRSIINTNPRGIDNSITHINDKNDSLLRFKSNNQKRFEDSIVKSTIVEGFHNLENDDNNNDYCSSSDVAPNENLIDFIKFMIMSKLKTKFNNLNNFTISNSAYEAITIVVEELVKELFLSWRNDTNAPIQTNEHILKGIATSQLKGYDASTNNQDIIQTIINRVLVLTGMNDNKETRKEIVSHLQL